MTASNDQLTLNQKREYLIILFRDGNEAAQIYLDESTPNNSWFMVLPLEIRANIIRFILKSDGKWVMTTEDYKIINDCLNCCPDNFNQCLQERKLILQSG